MATATVDFTSMDAGASDAGQTTEVDQSQVTSDVGDSGQQQDGQQQEQQQQADGRRGPADVRGAVKAAAEALPEQAATIKKLGDAYFRADAYAKVFPTVQDASSAKQLFDAVGGVDGVTQIQQRQQQYDAQDEQLKSGNPEAIDSAFKNFPDGMAALAPHYLDTLPRR